MRILIEFDDDERKKNAKVTIGGVTVEIPPQREERAMALQLRNANLIAYGGDGQRFELNGEIVGSPRIFVDERAQPSLQPSAEKGDRDPNAKS